MSSYASANMWTALADGLGKFREDLYRNDQEKKARQREEEQERKADELRRLQLAVQGVYKGKLPTMDEPFLSQPTSADPVLSPKVTAEQRKRPASFASAFMGATTSPPPGQTVAPPAGGRMPMGPGQSVARPGIGLALLHGTGTMPKEEAVRAKAAPMALATPAAPATPRYEALAGGYYRDNERTPEAMERRARAQEEAQQVAEALRVLQLRNVPNAETYAPIAADDPAFFRSLVATPEAETINVGGRHFPATPEGERAALAWQRQLTPERFDGGRGGSGSFTPGQSRSNAESEATGYALTMTTDPRFANHKDPLAFVRSAVRAQFHGKLPEGEIQRVAYDAVARARSGRAEPGRGDAPAAQHTAVQLVEAYGGDVSAVIRDMEAQPLDSSDRAVLDELRKLGYERGRRNILGVGASGAAQPLTAEELNAKYGPTR